MRSLSNGASTILKTLACVMVLSSCASLSLQPVEVPPPKLAPIPSEVLIERQPNYRERLLKLLGASDQKLTK